MPHSVLLLLPQMPQDPASGAARSMRTIAEILAASGFRVTALATTATERAMKLDAVKFLRAAGCEIAIDRRGAIGRGVPFLQFNQNRISDTLLHTGEYGISDWQSRFGKQFEGLFRATFVKSHPDILFTFGGRPEDQRRRAYAQSHGTHVVFGLRNLGYLHRGAFQNVNSILTPSQFITDRYRDTIGVESTPLPTPIALDDVYADDRQPIFTTFVNPSPAKGVMFFARLAEEVSVHRPDIPLLVIESRGTAGTLVRAGLRGGFDLRRHGNVMISTGVPQPRDIYAATRTLLVPSVWEEPSGRVVAEALVNGVPPIVSRRGGLVESCAGAGFVADLPSGLTTQTTMPVASEDVAEWLRLVVRLADDDDCYARASQKALQASQLYMPKKLRGRYVEFFRSEIEAKTQDSRS
jgi:glycosyltransferase involved in cell wall biosynthesis